MAFPLSKEELLTISWLRTWPQLSAHSVYLKGAVPLPSTLTAASIWCKQVWLYRLNMLGAAERPMLMKTNWRSMTFTLAGDLTCFSIHNTYSGHDFSIRRLFYVTSGTLSQTCVVLATLFLRYDTTLDISSDILTSQGAAAFICLKCEQCVELAYQWCSSV